MRRIILAIACLSGVTAAVAALADCGSFKGDSGAGGVDAAADDGSDEDAFASGEGGPGTPDSAADAAADAGTDGPTATYAALDDIGAWSVIDVQTFFPSATGFRTGAYDGRYVYITPNFGANFVRYDTSGDSTTPSSWESYNSGASTRVWVGTAFDGRYVVYAPWDNSGANNSLLVRYDTTTSFADGGDWTTFDLGNVAPGTGGFIGVGRGKDHLFFSSFGSPSLASLAIGAPLDAGFVLRTVSSPEPRFVGGVYANGAYYFAPDTNSTGLTAIGTVARLEEADAGAPDAEADITTYDYSTVQSQPTARGFSGAVSDGRYVYFVPAFAQGVYQSTVLRFDTAAQLGDSSAWRTFTIHTTLALPGAIGFDGSAFDGRYVYFVPGPRDATGDVNRTIVRYDTTQDFAAAASWSAYQLTNVNPAAGGFDGAVFDGEYIYLVPHANTVMLRFHARTPRAAPMVFPGGT